MTNKILYDLLEWDSGKVDGFLGKSLLDLNNGGVKIVKVRPFAKYPLHIHPNKTEFAFVIEGNLKMEIGDEVHFGKKGDFFIFPNTIEHSIESDTEKESILLVGAINN